MTQGWWTEVEWKPGLDETEARVLYLNGQYSGHVRKLEEGWVWAGRSGSYNFPAFPTREAAQAALIAAVRPYPPATVNNPLTQWWLWLTVCLPHGHDWQTNIAPTGQQLHWGNMAGMVWTPSSTCTRCGARSF